MPRAAGVPGFVWSEVAAVWPAVIVGFGELAGGPGTGWSRVALVPVVVALVVLGSMVLSPVVLAPLVVPDGAVGVDWMVALDGVVGLDEEAGVDATTPAAWWDATELPAWCQV